MRPIVLPHLKRISAMSLDLRKRLFNEFDRLVLVDPHTHINPLDPASHTLADILGYHYYTELAHSAGMPKDQIEEPGLAPKEKVRRATQEAASAGTCEDRQHPRRSELTPRNETP